MDNTVVTASDMNYFWGVLMLVGSMRCYGMEEPVIVSGIEYTQDAKEILMQFGDVKIVDVPRGKHSLTCQKPNAMLLAKTKYVTWVDCDGFFHGNCSDLLTPDNENSIHIRKRSLEENKRVYPNSPTGAIPEEILNIWRDDVGELSSPRINSCCSCCFLSLGTAQQEFLLRWNDQMNSVLPEGDIGVVDHRSKAYFQTDESVLNSLLCYMKNAPTVTEQYNLDKNPEAFFIHFVSHPKPWRGWTPYAFRHFARYVKVAEYLTSNHYRLPEELPYTLKAQNEFLCRMLQKPVMFQHKFKRLLGKFSGKF